MAEDTSFISGLLDLSGGSIIIGLIAAAALYWLMFKDFETFSESIKFWLFSNRHNSGNEMFSEEWWGATKIFLWIGLSAAIAYGANAILG